MDQFNAQERTPWADFFARRGRVLAAAGKGERGKALLDETREIIALGERMGFLIALPELRVAADDLAREEAGQPSA